MIAANPGDRPRYTRPKALASGEIAWFWEPPTADKRAGCPVRASALGTDLVEAFTKARRLNAALDGWRRGRDADIPATHGTLDWLFGLYRTDRKYRDLSAVSKKGYERALARVGKHKRKSGALLGAAPLTAITPAVVDKLYDRWTQAGLTREAELALTVAAIAWRVGRRKAPGDVPAVNPFDGVEKVRRRKAETTPATYGELVTFCSAAEELGSGEMAFAARACWDLLIRPEDVFTRLTWAHWRPADRPDQANGLSGKNDNEQWITLERVDEETGELVIFYPELEQYARQLDARGRKGALMVLRPKIRGREKAGGETAWAPYSRRLWAQRAAKIREKAKLGAHVTMTSFRHGGMTELGDAGLPDTLMQALSRHKQRATLDNYVHRTDVQRIEATRLRVAYRRTTQRPE